MLTRLTSIAVLAAFLVLAAALDGAQDKKRTGTLAGEIKSSKKSPNGKNQIIEVLASGEEKARSYRVQYDPKAKAPIATVLDAVRAANVGDRVEIDWIDTGEGLAITAFKVLKKGDKKDGDKEKK